jgi:hypothetical protein
MVSSIGQTFMCDGKLVPNINALRNNHFDIITKQLINDRRKTEKRKRTTLVIDTQIQKEIDNVKLKYDILEGKAKIRYSTRA